MAWTSFSAPSAVWIRLMPSWALRWACCRPRIWPRIFSEMARPAASSAARLIRRPDDSRSTDLPKAPALRLRLRQAFHAIMLWLMRTWSDLLFDVSAVPGVAPVPAVQLVLRGSSAQTGAGLGDRL